ncbi:nitrogen fixation protein NifM [Pseudothauera nasutitermitis]|uniref:peptidylprolyl isomerase n=1 Tax=Pseudothauera nasutitermitis TaxID=2565930 RepID=A0A4S4ATP3_9RHOO|nr:nitrogen fixation protein NifM [Pseudothauera nasutitermitis]THF62856.1 nitrogen fixation protein NifM [Pseudothauera nasutitermitis]
MNPLAYYELQAAHSLFGKAAGALEAGEARKVRAVAERYAEIEAAVLGSAEARGVCLQPEAIDDAFEEIRARYEDPAAFDDALDDAGLRHGDLRTALGRSLLVEAVMARVGARVPPVGETEAEIFYYTHLERFRSPETRTARHILITINDTLADNRREAAERRIGEIARRLAARPARFGEQAMKHSECPTALNGGLLGDMPRGQLYPELEAVLFALREGEVSAPVESELGFHVLLCERIHAERTLPWAEVAESLRTRLTEERSRRETRLWLQGLMATATVS